MNDIDAVIIWVDGSDQQWLREKGKYERCNTDETTDASEERFRDWDNLQYVFRGIERFMPWIRTVHFVTWGHVPAWLNLDAPRLHLVKHEDYIPAKYLPTFNSHTIEHNLFRINGLSDCFVYFNDDMFVLSKTERSDFFSDNELIVDTAGLNVHGFTDGIVNQLIPIMDIGIINKHFDMHDVIRKNRGKWINLLYGPVNLRTLALERAPRFPGMYYPHLPTSLRKSTMREVWSVESGRLDETCRHRFREASDVNQWLYRDWDIVKGEFVPRSYKFGRAFFLDRDGLPVLDEIVRYIEHRQGRVICINDGHLTPEEFALCKQRINGALASILPDKSSFEL